MAKLGTVTFTGESGTKYEFNVYPLDTDFQAVAAVYFFTKRTKKTDGSHTHRKHIYVGETEDLSDRFDNHHKMSCIERNGANCVCTHPESTESKRLEVEQDLIDAYSPVCNG